MEAYDQIENSSLSGAIGTYDAKNFALIHGKGGHG